MFTFKDESQKNLKQQFAVAPRFYSSNESLGIGGEGHYVFEPLDKNSKIYSKIRAITFKNGTNSGMFNIIYDDYEERGLKYAQRATLSLELNEFSNFITHELNLNQIPIMNIDYNEEVEM